MRKSLDPGIKKLFSNSFMVMPRDKTQVDLHQWKLIMSRVIQKEKGRKVIIKGKLKGKDGWWNTSWAFGRGRGNGKGGGKGKGEKGSGRGKG